MAPLVRGVVMSGPPVAWTEAVGHYQAGRLAAAEAACRRVLTQIADQPDALGLLAVAVQQQGRAAEAETLFARLTVLQPKQARAWNNLANNQAEQGKREAAVGSYRRALALQPDYPVALKNLGQTLRELGRLPEALDCYRRAVALQPGYAEAQLGLGVTLSGLGQASEAVAALRQAIAAKPDYAEAYSNLGNALKAAGALDEAIAAYERAIALRPDFAEAHSNLGFALSGKPGFLAEALRHCSRAVELRPDYVEGLVNLGQAQEKAGNLRAALDAVRRAICLRPDSADLHNNLGMVLHRLGQLDESLESFGAVLRLKPQDAEAHAYRAMVLDDLGFHKVASDTYRRAIALDTDSATFHRYLRAGQLYGSQDDERRRFEDCRRYMGLVGKTASRERHFDPPATASTRLRIGYVSSDLYHHPVGRNLFPVFANHNRRAFEVFVYPTSPESDDLADEFRRQADGWHSLVDLDDSDAAAVIRRDRIDVLLFLAAGLERNRPTIALHRAAPVQVSFHDPATSGIAAMDFLIGDSDLTPRGTTERFVERVVRLPRYYIHAPLAGAPPVGPLPASRNGYVTFGSFNNPTKIGDDCLALWGKTLAAVPGSRMLLRYRNFYGSRILQSRIVDRLAIEGVARERIEFITAEAGSGRQLDIFSRVDMALDTSPFTGSTTTFESLWMGLPVVTLSGTRMVSRWSASILRALKLSELVAETPDAYVTAASRLAMDLPRLAELRAGLRDRLASSSLCDGRLRARQFERLLRAMWLHWWGGAGAESRDRSAASGPF